MYTVIGLFIGCVLFVLIASRIITLLIMKFVRNPYRLLLANGCALLIAVIVGGHIFPSYGEPNYSKAFSMYLPGFLVWVVFDTVWWIRKFEKGKK